MISIQSSGNFNNTERFLHRMANGEIYNTLRKYGQIGVDALSNATPIDTRETSEAWYYEIIQNRRYWGIIWHNRHVDDGRPVAILLQYGHATGTGGFVQGRDYINPVIKPLFNQIADECWREVRRK